MDDRADGDCALAVDASEGIIRIDDGDEIAETEIAQTVAFDHRIVEALNIVVAAHHRRAAEPTPHHLRRNDLRDARVHATFADLDAPCVEKIRVGVKGAHFGGFEQAQTEPATTHLHRIADRHLLHDLRVEIGDDVLDAAMRSRHAPERTLRIAGEHAHASADAGA